MATNKLAVILSLFVIGLVSMTSSCSCSGDGVFVVIDGIDYEVKPETDAKDLSVVCSKVSWEKKKSEIYARENFTYSCVCQRKCGSVSESYDADKCEVIKPKSEDDEDVVVKCACAKPISCSEPAPEGGSEKVVNDGGSEMTPEKSGEQTPETVKEVAPETVTACKLDKDCKNYQRCTSGKCVARKCTANEQCPISPESTHCKAGTCQLGCGGKSTQCVPGMICDGNDCVKSCKKSSDCPQNPRSFCKISGNFGFCRKVQCLTSAECQKGQTCKEFVCVDGCVADSDCATGQKCSGGKCVSSCKSRSDCKSDEWCNSGTCMKVECYVDGDCTDGRKCIQFTCIKDTGCKASSECPAEQYCSSGKCIAGCDADARCGSGKVCVNAKCITGCRRDTDCPSGQACNASNKCVAKPTCSTGYFAAGSLCVPTAFLDENAKPQVWYRDIIPQRVWAKGIKDLGYLAFGGVQYIPFKSATFTYKTASVTVQYLDIPANLVNSKNVWPHKPDKGFLPWSVWRQNAVLVNIAPADDGPNPYMDLGHVGRVIK